jgi:hypothetical protein
MFVDEFVLYLDTISTHHTDTHGEANMRISHNIVGSALAMVLWYRGSKYGSVWNIISAVNFVHNRSDSENKLPNSNSV